MASETLINSVNWPIEPSRSLDESSMENITVCDLRTAVEVHSDETVNVVWWTNVVCLPSIAFIGLACNILNILILTSNRSAKRMPSWNLLLALAICDCLFLIFAVVEVTPISIGSLVAWPIFNFLYAHSVLYIRTLASTFYKTSVLIVVSFNLERYICVCHPLRSHRLCTTRASRMAIAFCIVISLLCSLQWPICYQVQSCWDPSIQRYFYMVGLRSSPSLQLYYRSTDYLSLIGFNVLPILILCTLNMKLIITLRKVVDQDMARGSCCDTENGGQFATGRTLLTNGALISVLGTRSSTAQRFNANAMLFAVVIMLLICVGPQALARLLFEYFGQYHSTAIAYTCITQQLVFLNAALNFCLYCLVSKRYRTLLKQTLKRLIGRANKYVSKAP
uniref:G_PROTEIN_RECEP_F1_2 domain-containing protein n=1 Tax=Syphacia muris TaxID=451379 RepID=A0A0N5ATS4_9BILA